MKSKTEAPIIGPWWHMACLRTERDNLLEAAAGLDVAMHTVDVQASRQRRPSIVGIRFVVQQIFEFW